MAATLPNENGHIPAWYRELSFSISESRGTGMKIPVYLRMSNNCLLRVCEENRENGEIHFYKTSSGYGVQGIKANVIVVGGGVENPVGNIYSEISAREVAAYFDQDWTTIYDRAVKQRGHMPLSTDPDKIKRIFAGAQYSAETQAEIPKPAHVQQVSSVNSENPNPIKVAFAAAERAGKMQYPTDWNDWDESARDRFRKAWYWAQIPAIPMERAGAKR